MIPDEQIARMEYLAAKTAMPLVDLCARLSEQLELPKFELFDDDDTHRAFALKDEVEITVTRPASGSLRDWLAYAPADYTHGVNLTIGRRHATILKREWDYLAVASPVGQALADITGHEALHYGSWVSANRSTRREIRFTPNLPSA